MSDDPQIADIEAALSQARQLVFGARVIAGRLGRRDVASQCYDVEGSLLTIGRLLYAEPIPKRTPEES